MPLPCTITPSVSQDAIKRVGRLYNSGPVDCLVELLQNSRRAGARRVDIELASERGNTLLIIRDDGAGIADPASLLTLGRSDWNESIATGEDPAGMGVFSLAGFDVEYRSWSSVAGTGWRVKIPAGAWSDDRPLSVEPWDHPGGTEVRIHTTTRWNEYIIASAIEKAASHFPVPIFSAGRRLPSFDWLAGAHHVEPWAGGRIGIFRNESARCLTGDPTINFQGATLRCPLPWIGEVDGPTWTARYDVGPTSALRLVLPARKEVVQDAAEAALREACLAAIFRTIAKEQAHRLSFRDWQQGREAGVELPEADPWLHAWAPATGEASYRQHGERVRAADMVIVQDFDPDLAQCADRFFQRHGSISARLVHADGRFAGYSWFDRLPRIVDLRFTVQDGGTEYRHSAEETEVDGRTSRRVDRILFTPIFKDGREVEPAPADILIVRDPYGCDGLDDTLVLLSRDAAIEVEGLAHLLERSAFQPSDDSGADSYETQQSRFRAEANQVAADLLLSEDEATLFHLRAILRRHCWLIPSGRTVAATIGRDTLTLTFVDDRNASGSS